MPGAAELWAVLGGYLIGAIPTGVLAGSVRGIDPRAAGSGRTGTTNALRTLGPALAVVVLLVDVAKGVLAAIGAGWLANRLGADASWPMALAGVGAVVGHVRSIFIRFGGGRGVATGGGAVLVLAPLALAVVIPTFALVVWRTRYVSLGSVAAAVVLPLAALGAYGLGWADLPAVVAATAIGLLVVVAHADNIARLRAGTERRLGRG